MFGDPPARIDICFSLADKPFSKTFLDCLTDLTLKDLFHYFIKAHDKEIMELYDNWSQPTNDKCFYICVDSDKKEYYGIYDSIVNIKGDYRKVNWKQHSFDNIRDAETASKQLDLTHNYGGCP